MEHDDRNAKSPELSLSGEEASKGPPLPAVPTFEQYYLSCLTKEFASDIDKLRAAPDFRDHHVPILVEALGQGASIYSPEEKARVMGTRGRLNERVAMKEKGNDQGECSFTLTGDFGKRHC